MNRLILLAALALIPGACTFLVGEAKPEDAGISFPDFSMACSPALLTSDVHNCGACGRDCTRLPGVDPTRARCVLGVCELTGACQIARGDCTDRSDGCETDFSTISNCGACGNACGGTLPRCIGTATGSYTCSVTCGGTTPTQCGSECVDTETNPRHCLACFNDCPDPLNGFAVCDFLGCNFDCNPGFIPTANACIPSLVDMSIPIDLTLPPDLRMVDLRMVDMRMVDMRMSDMASGDLAGVDASDDAATLPCFPPTTCLTVDDCLAVPGCTVCTNLGGFGICQ
jgi:hypothetical protein